MTDFVITSTKGKISNNSCYLWKQCLVCRGFFFIFLFFFASHFEKTVDCENKGHLLTGIFEELFNLSFFFHFTSRCRAGDLSRLLHWTSADMSKLKSWPRASLGFCSWARRFILKASPSPGCLTVCIWVPANC